MTNFSIKVVENKFDVAVKGHTGYEDRGYDIVCASISTMVNITVNLIDNFGYNVYDLSIKDGYLSFKCDVNDTTKIIIKTLEDDLSSLSKQYPDFIKKI